MKPSSIHPALLFGLDAAELLLITRPLAEVLRRLSTSDTATIPPPRG